jgi:Putative transposase
MPNAIGQAQTGLVRAAPFNATRSALLMRVILGALTSRISKPLVGQQVQGGNFAALSPTDFIAAVTQHIPDKGFQLVPYYGGYSNKEMRCLPTKELNEKRC